MRARPALAPFFLAAFLAGVAHDVLPNLFVIYSGFRYAWDERSVGLALALVGVSSIVVQGAVVGRVVARFGERRALAAGLVIGILGQLVFGLAPTGAVFLLGIPIWALFGLVSPSLQGLMTRLVGATEQGQLQGALASFRAVASVTAPLLFTQIFALSVGELRAFLLPGAPFLAAAVLLAGSLGTVVRAATARAPERLAPA